MTINGIQYAFSGTSAAVVSGYDYNDKYVSSDKYMHYSNESYVIPSSIEYDGRTYSVDKIGQHAFDDGNISYPYSSKIKSIKLPATIRFISKGAFMGTSITEMIIPSKVETFGAYWWEDGSIFHNCDHLATLIYTPVTAPSNWVATTKTYVPDKVSYSSPFAKMNDAHIIEMISFADSIFSYTGQVPNTTWTNNVEGYTAALTMPTLKKDAGSYKEIIPVTFTKGEESFTANVVYRYTVKPAHLIAKAENAAREYGEENPQFIISYNGFIGGEDENSFTIRPKVKTTAVKTSDVGAYPITISGGNSTNYEFEYESGLLTITAAPLSVRVADIQKYMVQKTPHSC